MSLLPRPRTACGRIAAGVGAGAALACLLAGPPWALARFVGWPLPDQLPAIAEVFAALTRPPDSALLVDVLAGACWIAWAAFVLDVVLAAGAALHDIAIRTGGRGRVQVVRQSGQRWRPGAALVAVLLFALLAGSRPTTTTAPGPAVLSQPLRADNSTGEWVEVREPARGVHDSLWRIADRELGDPTRWPELFDRNAGQPQPDGHTLQEPDLIQPGWHLAMPASPDNGGSAPTWSSHRVESPPQTPPEHARPAVPAGPELRDAPDGQRPASDDWVTVGPGVVVGTGFATLIAAAVAVARHRRRGGDGDEFPVMPVVRELTYRLPAPDDVEDDGDDSAPHPVPVPASAHAAQHQERRSSAVHAMEPSAWRPLLDAAVHEGGLGLAGPGGLAAMRALLVELILTARRAAIVVVDDLPERLGVAVDELAALGVVHVDGLDRALASETLAGRDRGDVDEVVVLASTPEPARSSGRLAPPWSPRTVLVLHGPWPDGVTGYVRTDGTIAAAGPAAHADLVGRQLPLLDVIAAGELLDLAREHETRVEPGDQIVDPRGDTPPPTAVAETSAPAPNSERDQRTAAPPLPGAAWSLSILGRPALHACRVGARDITSVLSPRMLSLLVFLALHPNGVRRDAAVAALWPDSGRGRPGNNLSSLISRLRTAIRSTYDASTPGAQPGADLILVDSDRYRLDPDHVSVDYWAFLSAVADHPSTAGGDGRAGDQQVLALLAAHGLYRGPLGDGIDDEWILSVREAARRSFLGVTAQLVRHYVGVDPSEAVQLLEVVRNLEPTNQAIYRDIVALQLQAGHNSGAAVTMRLLESQLADIEETPDEATRILAQEIEKRIAADINDNAVLAGHVPEPRRSQDEPAGVPARQEG